MPDLANWIFTWSVSNKQSHSQDKASNQNNNEHTNVLHAIMPHSAVKMPVNL